MLSIVLILKKEPERKLIGTIKKFETVLCESQLYDKKPVKAPKEEKIKIQRRR